MDEPNQYPVLIIGREIVGTGSSRYMRFRLSLPPNLHHTLADGTVIDYVNTRYSYVEGLRTALLQEFASLDLPMLDSKRLMGSLSSSVVNQRTRIINNFLRTCQESNTIKASRQWGEFLRGQKPGMTPGSANAPPTVSQLRSEARTDAAPPPRLSENPATAYCTVEAIEEVHGVVHTTVAGPTDVVPLRYNNLVSSGHDGVAIIAYQLE